MRRLLALVLLGAAFCAGGAEARVPLDRILGLHTLAFPLGETEAQIRSHLGAPRKVQVRTLTNPHDPKVTDRVTRLVYPDLAVEVFLAGFDGREFVTELTLSSPRHRLQGGLGVGSSRAEALRQLGPPHGRDGETEVWATESGYQELRLTYRKGRIGQMQFLSFPD